MTASSQPGTSDTPSPESSSSSSPPSLALNISAAVVSVATIGAIVALAALHVLPPNTPWWGILGSLLIAGMAASERARLLGTAVRRVLPGRTTSKE